MITPFPINTGKAILVSAFMMLAPLVLSAGSTITVKVAYQDPHTSQAYYGKEPVYLLPEELHTSLEKVFPKEKDQTLILLKWVRGHISSAPGKVMRDFDKNWPDIPLKTAHPDSKGTAVFENVPPGEYYVVSFAYLRRYYHRDGRYKKNANWQILYKYHVWIWDYPASVGENEKLNLKFDDLNNTMGGYF